MRWSPAHEAHAIERVTATVTFSEPVNSKPFRGLIGSLGEKLLRLGFDSQVATTPNPLPNGGPGIQQFIIGPTGVMQSHGEGRVFRFVDGQDLREEVLFYRDRVHYSATRYARWGSFVSRYREVLGHEIEAILPTVPTQTAQLEYWDRFNFDGDPSEVDYSELFSAGSRYLPSFLQEARDLMHSHVGFFVPSSEGNRFLINVNIDAVDLMPMAQDGHQSAPVRSVGIYTFAQERMEAPRSEKLDFSDLVSTFNQQHAILNTIVGGVISDSMARRISLKASA